MYSGRLLLEYDGICMMEYGGQWDSMGDIYNTIYIWEKIDRIYIYL